MTRFLLVWFMIAGLLGATACILGIYETLTYEPNHKMGPCYDNYNNEIIGVKCRTAEYPQLPVLGTILLTFSVMMIIFGPLIYSAIDLLRTLR